VSGVDPIQLHPSTRPRIKRRPALVWFIGSFCISSGLYAILYYYQIAHGMHPLPESKLAYFANYSAADYWPLVAVNTLTVLAGALLIMLRKAALYAFALKFVLAVGVAVWDALTLGAPDTSEPEYIVVGLLLWGGSAAVVFYAWYLMRKGVLK
jgi:hypothetical protein